jgi:hypothetical protein
LADKEDLQVFLEAVNRLHERMDGLASKSDLTRVESTVNRIDATVDALSLTLAKNYVTYDDQDKRCAECEKKQDAEGARRRWYVGIILSAALTVGTIVGRWVKW